MVNSMTKYFLITGLSISAITYTMDQIHHSASQINQQTQRMLQSSLDRSQTERDKQNLNMSARTAMGSNLIIPISAQMDPGLQAQVRLHNDSVMQKQLSERK